MKLIIQIPCLNEEATLPSTISDLPREIPGISEIEVLVVDDGSTDGTVETARRLGVDHILSLGNNRGLGRAFSAGISHAIQLGADIVVNTDADNQYCGEDIARLVEPILANRADLVVGCRPISDHPEFGMVKKCLQKTGSWVLRILSKTTVRDAASGFRAFSREACQRLFVYSRFSYCMETLIQAGNSSLRVESTDIRVNSKTRESRLFRSIPEYIWKSGSTMVAMFVLYRPGRFFLTAASLFLGLALILGIRFIYLVFLTSHPESHRTYLPSLILLCLCGLIGTLLVFLGVLGELMKSQRRITEEVLFLARRQWNHTSGN